MNPVASVVRLLSDSVSVISGAVLVMHWRLKRAAGTSHRGAGVFDRMSDELAGSGRLHCSS